MPQFELNLKTAWKVHGERPKEALQLVSNLKEQMNASAHLVKLAQLIVHVCGEHLADYQIGLEHLHELENSKFNDSESQLILARSKAVLQISENSKHNISEFSSSEQIKIFATSASGLVQNNKIETSKDFFQIALGLAETLRAEDTAHRSLAVAGNNLACVFEEKESRTQIENEFMVSAAQAARKHWELAGTWLEVERAEYRLAQTYFKLKDFINSIKHANLCLTICEKNNAEALEFFFAYEAIAQIEKAIKQPLRSLDKMKTYFDKLSPDDQEWCLQSLEKLST